MEQTRQWERVKDLFDAALRRDPAERSDFLALACSGDDLLRSEVESLLSAYARSDQLSRPADFDQYATQKQGPRQIGPYRLIRKIGEGGMGQVWLAEQSKPLPRQVAIKLIRAGLYDAQLLRRFHAERESLARMEHPTIAKVFDAGATPEDQPFLVMEYVPGKPITEYCDEKKLTIRQRLELFAEVCDGVQHAHQKAVIHRDLKPGNILVIDIDGKPTPRIIDFGLAKALTEQASGENLLTRSAAVIGTPGYTSPEQWHSTTADVDTRTDVYSLGVILYELLTGELPFDRRLWLEQPMHKTMRQLQEEDAVRPSTKVHSSQQAGSLAERRAIQPKELVSQLRGDLDWIAMKAIERDRDRRYATPSELAADVRRYLQHEPVLARPASLSYRFQKYVRRHRIAVSAATALVFLLAAFGVNETVQLRRITLERDHAARERDRANRITDFMTGMFKVSDPSEARGNSITAREILDKASKNISTGLARDPQLQAQMAATMGKVYASLGLYPQSQSLLEESVGVSRRALGAEAPDALRVQADLAWILRLEGHYSDAESMLRQTLAAEQHVLGPDSPDTIKCTSNLAVVLSDEGRFDDAESMFRAALEGRIRALGPNHTDTIIARNNLATLLFNQHKFPEAEKLYREVLDVRERTLGSNHPYTLLSMNNLAVTLHSEGNYVEAAKLKRETLEIRKQVLGPEHPDTLLSMSNLADTLMQMNEYSQAETLLRQALTIQQRVLGPENPQTIISMTNLADALIKERRYVEAETLLRSALELQRKVLGPNHPNTAMSIYTLACIQALLGERSPALASLRDALTHGLPPWALKDLATDQELASLHGDPRFTALLKSATDQPEMRAAQGVRR